MKKSKKIIKTILVLPLVLGLFFSSLSSLVFASQTGTITATVRINSLEVTIVVPREVAVGEHFFIEADISNLSQARIEGVEATVFFPEDSFLLKGSEERELGTLPPNKTKTVKWHVIATSEGDSLVTVVAKSEDYYAEDAAMIDVKAWISFWSLIRRFLARA